MNEGSINLLPAEMIEEILSYFEPKELVTVSMASKETFFVHAERRLITNKARHLSTFVAQGKQEEAKQLLEKSLNTQTLLLTPSFFTDYSSRTFNCTAYEYAYWAKDTHMCRMLEQLMDAGTKKVMLEYCEAIERDGLSHQRNGDKITGSKHFDFTPLITALSDYVQKYGNWFNTCSFKAMNAAWMAVRLAQRDVPVHVINEYCRPERSFDPTPEFDETTLPRVLTCYDAGVLEYTTSFPWVFFNSSAVRVDFALLRGSFEDGARRAGGPAAIMIVEADLAAIKRLDEVRTAELILSRDILRATEQEQSSDMTC